MDTQPIDTPEAAATGLLVGVTTDEELLESVRSGFERELVRYRDTAADLEGSPIPAIGSAQFSTTYTQETSIDEHDVVKYNGRHLYIAPSLGMSCCFLPEPELGPGDSEDAVLPNPVPISRAIRILSTNADTAQASQVGAIDLNDEMTVEGLYIEEDRLAVITSTAWWGHYGAAFDLPQSWADQSTGFRLFDVSSPEYPTKLLDVEVEGGFVTSRRAGNTVYLITRHFPTIDGLHLYPADEAASEQAMQLLQVLTVEDIIPRVRVDGQESQLFAASDCVVEDSAHKLAPQQRGYPVLTVIIAIDLGDPGITDTLCYAGETSGVYVSPNAIYLTQSDYNDVEGPQTLVHRFDYPESLQYRGSGKVTGDLHAGANPDFRISEYGDYLRLVTTIWTNSQQDAVEHFLHVLQLAADSPELDSIAILPSASRPDPIGKPNEDLYGVRFLGDRAYLVTFERTDPLYVIDLSDHREPRIAGELEVTGFSDFLHPVNDALLLGLGQDQNGRVKLELFDIANLAQPVSRGAVTLAEDAQWSYSEARYDRHAFTYLADEHGIDRFTVPVNTSSYEDDLGYTAQERLHLLEVRDKDEPGTASIVDLGYISASPNPLSNSGNSRSRAVIHEDAVFFISGELVWSALWGDPSNATGPQ